jgi:hypothetical protein
MSAAAMWSMRFGFSAFMLVHGIAHLVGFLGAWAPTRTTVIGDRVDLGTSWIKLVGIGWLVMAIGFAVTAFAAAIGAGGWPSWALGITLASLALCVLQLPETKIGLVLNVVLLGGLLALRAGWL